MSLIDTLTMLLLLSFMLLFLSVVLHTHRKRRWQMRDELQDATIRDLRVRLNETFRQLHSEATLRLRANCETRQARRELAELKWDIEGRKPHPDEPRGQLYFNSSPDDAA